jgi:hypothetical protein
MSLIDFETITQKYEKLYAGKFVTLDKIDNFLEKQTY